MTGEEDKTELLSSSSTSMPETFRIESLRTCFLLSYVSVGLDIPTMNVMSRDSSLNKAMCELDNRDSIFITDRNLALPLQCQILDGPYPTLSPTQRLQWKNEMQPEDEAHHSSPSCADVTTCGNPVPQFATANTIPLYGVWAQKQLTGLLRHSINY
jgi:hypothetical protein